MVVENVEVGQKKVKGREIILRNYLSIDSAAVGQEINFRAIRAGTADFNGDKLELWDCGKASNYRDELIKKQAAKLAADKTLLEGVEKKLSPIQEKIVKVQGELDAEKSKVQNEYKSKVEDLPSLYAKQLKDTADAKRQAVVDKLVKYNQDAADKGDPVGLLRMGERYRDGEGVPKDLKKAREYLAKAAAAGSPTADDELKQLPAN